MLPGCRLLSLTVRPSSSTRTSYPVARGSTSRRVSTEVVIAIADRSQATIGE